MNSVERECSKPTCSGLAAATVTFDYSGLAAAIGPLAPAPSTSGHDLCSRHAKSFSVPDGWSLLRHVESSGDR